MRSPISVIIYHHPTNREYFASVPLFLNEILNIDMGLKLYLLYQVFRHHLASTPIGVKRETLNPRRVAPGREKNEKEVPS